MVARLTCVTLAALVAAGISKIFHRKRLLRWQAELEGERRRAAEARVDAAHTNGSLERVYLEAHAHAPKTCDKCRAPQACDVDVLLEQSARALVLSVGWPSSNVPSDDVMMLLAFVGRSGARDCGRAGAIWPDAFTTFPAGAAVQSLCPSSAWYVPEGQR